MAHWWSETIRPSYGSVTGDQYFFHSPLRGGSSHLCRAANSEVVLRDRELSD